jgi:hypothetical protein
MIRWRSRHLADAPPAAERLVARVAGRPAGHLERRQVAEHRIAGRLAQRVEAQRRTQDGQHQQNHGGGAHPAHLVELAAQVGPAPGADLPGAGEERIDLDLGAGVAVEAEVEVREIFRRTEPAIPQVVIRRAGGTRWARRPCRPRSGRADRAGRAREARQVGGDRRADGGRIGRARRPDAGESATIAAPSAAGPAAPAAAMLGGSATIAAPSAAGSPATADPIAAGRAGRSASG